MSVRSASSNCFYGIKLDFTHFTLPFNVLIKKIFRFNANENEWFYGIQVNILLLLLFALLAHPVVACYILSPNT